MAYQSFEELEVWKRSCRLAVDICRTVAEWKNFGLRDQIQRAAVSVPSNIAEGQERDYDGDNIRFLRIAKGSCAELRTQLYIAQSLNLLSPEISKPFIDESKEISAMLQGLIRYTLSQKNLSKH